jgi:hypothetical protein
VYDFTGVLPTGALMPADTEGYQTAPGRAPRPGAPVVWLLVGGACAAVIAAALVIIGWISQSGVAPAVATRATGAPQVLRVAADHGLGAPSGSVGTALAFCKGAPEARFHFVVDGLLADIPVRWELRRDGSEISGDRAMPYGENNRNITVQVGSGDGGGMPPGQYELLLYGDEEVLWVQSFEVLAVTPRASSLQVSDRPDPIASTELRPEFEAGVGAIYLRYVQEVLCSGLEVSHTLFAGAEPVQTVVQLWQGAGTGEAEVVFEAPDGGAFSPGDYEANVVVAGEEQGRVQFSILGG